MRRLGLLLRLLANLLRGAALSGWQSAQLILRDPGSRHGVLVRLDYGELSPAAASLLAALITLTPGTTAVHIDTERHELLLHLLDREQAETTLEAIRQELIHPLAQLCGGRP